MPTPQESTMPLTAHLEELRWRIVKAAGATAVAFAITYGFANSIFHFLTAPLVDTLGDQVGLIGTGVTEAFFTKLKVALIAALFLASPAIFFQVWGFIAPGLYDHEKNYARPFVFFATFFFLLGAAFCFYAVFPVAFTFFVEEFVSIGVSPTLRITEYLAFSSRMLLAFGVIFEMPVFTFFLARIGLVDHRMMIRSARYAVVIIFIIAAILTPADAASQVMMAVPMLFLYGMSIGIAYAFQRPAKSPAPEEPGDPDETPRGGDAASGETETP
jgi:sec-independent protein translocase protein TatC